MPEDESKWVLWDTGGMSLQAAFNPAISREEGFHLVLLQKGNVPSPWDNPKFYSLMSLVAAEAVKVLAEHSKADWFNFHCDGNIGAAEGNPKMHIHIFGRYRTGPLWGGPLQLPSGEGPYGYEPLTDEEIKDFRSLLAGRLDSLWPI